jgi:hypothetical protein
MAAGGAEGVLALAQNRHHCETLANPSRTGRITQLPESTSCGNRPVRRANLAYGEVSAPAVVGGFAVPRSARDERNRVQPKEPAH